MADPAGFRPWRVAWAEALYGERGFYRRAEGPRGHFETSANAPGGEVRLLAEAFVRLAEQHGCRRIVDVGAGRGELVAAIIGVLADASTGSVDGVLGVDVVPRPPGLPAEVDWLESPGGEHLPDGLTSLDRALVLAHEWLDVVPCDVLQVDPGGELRVVEVDGQGVERLGDPPAEAVLAWAEGWWPSRTLRPGQRVEAGLTRDAAWADLLTRIRSGLAVAVDYGHLRGSRPPRGTLAGHQAGRLVPPVPDGSCDLTADVAWDSLPTGSDPLQLTSQRAALTELGLTGRRPAPGGDPTAYLLALQRSATAATLLDPGGLGGLSWLSCAVPGPAGGIGQAEPAPARLES
jgi:SAM-dependent MidA family methyltransferase